MSVVLSVDPALATNALGPVVSPSFNAPANSLIVVAASGQVLDTISNTQGALTWEVAAERSNGARDVRIWTAKVASAKTGMTVTVGGADAIGGTKVWVVTDQDQTDPIGASNNGASATNNLTASAFNATAAGSLSFAVGYENIITAGTGQEPTSTDIESTFSMNLVYYTAGAGIFLRKAAVSGALGESITFNFDADGTATADWMWAAVEILPVGSINAEAALTVIPVPAAIPAPAVTVDAGPNLPTIPVPAAIPAPAVTAGAGAPVPAVAVAVAVPTMQVTTENAEIVTPTTITVPATIPTPAVQTSSQVDLAAVDATATIPAMAVRADASVTIGLNLTVAIPAMAVTVPILPGDNMDGDPGQMEFNGTLLGRSTAYRWRTLTGYRDRPGVDSGNAPRPTRHGSWAGRPLLQERTLTWVALLRAIRDEVEAAVGALEQALPVEDDETEHPLVVNDLGTPYLLFGRIDKVALPVDKQLRLGLGQLTLQWVCSDPRRYNINSTGVTIAVDDDANISNAGNIATHPLLRVHGPVDTPAVLNETLNRLVSFDVVLAVGEQLLIDCDRGTATIDGADVMGNLTGSSVHPSDFVLGRGTNVVSHSAAADGLKVDVLYRDAWA